MTRYDKVDAPIQINDELPSDVLALVERGKFERTVLLPGAEGEPTDKQPYARTHVEIAFADETMLRKCVALLRWSDERLKNLPDLLAMWRWDRAIREDMTIYFSTTWFDKEFFEARQHAFMERSHLSYYEKFGATPADLKTRHEILAV